MRINKYIASCGAASRRKAEEMILEGRIKVNGKTVTVLGTEIEEDDIVTLDGKIIKVEEQKVYIMLNKPVGYVTTLKDEHDRKIVTDLLPKELGRIFPVGRLDYDTSGLLLMTNDGDLTYKLTHPKHEVTKVYRAKVKGFIREEAKKMVEEGIDLEEYVTSPGKLHILKRDTNSSMIELEIHEGKNRQVRKMCETLGTPVLKLKRISFGNIGLGALKTGEWRHLTKSELDYLNRLGGSKSDNNKKGTKNR